MFCRWSRPRRLRRCIEHAPELGFGVRLSASGSEGRTGRWIPVEQGSTGQVLNVGCPVSSDL